MKFGLRFLVDFSGRQFHSPLFLAALLGVASCNAHSQEQRLSDWLLAHPTRENDYLLGTIWSVPDQIPVQNDVLLQLLSGLNANSRAEAASRVRLRNFLRSLKVTGRVPLQAEDARWLKANPARDPIIRAGDVVTVPLRPNTVTVITDAGFRCVTAHDSTRKVSDYLEACNAVESDWAWIAQPDGRISRFGVAHWNTQAEDNPAPGAWIWAPSRRNGWSQEFSEKFIYFLSTQGPAPDKFQQDPKGERQPPHLSLGGASSAIQLDSLLEGGGDTRSAGVSSTQGILRLPKRKAADPEITANDWGVTGLLQTPTARTPRAGNLVFALDRAYPYVRANILTSPFDWMEAGLRYTNIENRLYGPASFSGSQAYKDKAFDIKFRLVNESAFVPEVAIGFQDMSGTGLFSGEYMVANKRTGPFDWSAGVGWGYLGSSANFRNPLSRVNSRFDTRAAPVGQGGNFSISNYFHGSAALFGGVQYQTPIEKLILKAEYEGNDYRHEPLTNNLSQRTPFNFGLIYRYSSSVDLSAALERGNTVMLGVTLRTQLDEIGMPKSSDPAPISISISRPSVAPDWSMTAADINQRTGWRIRQIERQGRELRLLVDDAGGIYWRDRLDRVAAVLHRDAPSDIDRFVISYRVDGINDTEHVIDRAAWVLPFTRPLLPREQIAPVSVRRFGDGRPDATNLYANPRPRFEAGLGMGYQQVIGGPDAFYLYQVSAVESFTLRLRDDTWLAGSIQLPLFDNYDRFKFSGTSELPRVRTFQREYFTSPGLHVPDLQMSHVGRLTQNQFYSFYGGYLEPMFGGAGGEWLYRPVASNVAFGIDLNEVRQRDFDQRFDFRDYRTRTGHATVYWDTGWNNILATFSAGRYLAGDLGGTIEVSKLFDNGIAIGAFATKTNVSAEQFGEGSFDKGMYVRIPFDAMLTRSSRSVANFVYRPLTRDGGQKLIRPVSLYDETKLRDERTLRFRPAPVPAEYRIPEDRPGIDVLRQPLQPLTKVEPRPMEFSNNADVSSRLEQVLFSQGFRDVRVTMSGSQSIAIELAGGQYRPISRAMARAARAAYALAPIGTRELIIGFSIDGHISATYEFIDFEGLKQFFTGQLSKGALAKLVKVRYLNPSVSQTDPLEFFDETSTVGTESMPVLLSDPLDRVWRDMKGAAKVSGQIDWLTSGTVGIGVVAAASFLDKRAFNFAKQHQQNRMVKGGTKIGDAIPFVALAGAGAGALLTTEPTLSRSSYASLEAGGTAVLASTALKYLVGRQRPTSADSPRDVKPLSFTSSRDSFPSRHTTVAWAAITPFAVQYDAPWLYGLAGVTQLGRIASRQHWFSDTVAGSLLGTAIGQVFQRVGNDNSLRTSPQVSLNPEGVTFAWTFN